jgi:uncharacterized membrane protein YraQ (UPF0718 family)
LSAIINARTVSTNKAKPAIRIHKGLEAEMLSKNPFRRKMKVGGKRQKSLCKKETKKRTTFKEDAGKLLLDLGKLVFGGLFIGGILRGEIPQVILIAIGSVIAMIFFILGLLCTVKEKKEDKEYL